MHVRCLTMPDMAGERFICSGPFLMMADVAAILRQGLGQQGRKIPKRKLPDWVMRLVGRFDPVVRQVLGELGNVRDTDISHARTKLGWHPRPPEESVLDTARDMIRLGIVKV